MKYPLFTTTNNNSGFIQCVQKLLTTVRQYSPDFFSDHILLHHDLTEDNQRLLSDWGWTLCEMPPIDDDLVAGTPWSTETWMRNLIPQHFDESCCLYLDADMFLQNSIEELQSLPKLCQDKLASVVSGKGDAIFNAGFMFMNLDKWREADLSEKVFEVGRRHYERYGPKVWQPSQSSLNLMIPVKYRHYLPLLYNFSPSDFTHNVESPRIVHWKGVKPWVKHLRMWKTSLYIREEWCFYRYWSYVKMWNEIEPKTSYSPIVAKMI